MAEEMLTLPKFEEASEIVKKVTQETKLVYSKYFSEQTGNKVYLKPEKLCIITSSIWLLTKCRTILICSM